MKKYLLTVLLILVACQETRTSRGDVRSLSRKANSQFQDAIRDSSRDTSKAEKLDVLLDDLVSAAGQSNVTQIRDQITSLIKEFTILPQRLSNNIAKIDSNTSKEDLKYFTARVRTLISRRF